MFAPIEFPPEVESLVRFVEETPPSKIIQGALTKLRDGVSRRDLIRASALAVVRSTELPASHHGGPVHPIAALRGCFHTAQRLSGELGLLPIIQHVTLSNHHVHSPHMGPYIMPALSAMDGSVDAPYETFHDVESSIIHLDTAGTNTTTRAHGETGSTVDALLNNLQKQRPVAAEQCCLWLLENASADTVLDAMLPSLIARNHMDDHYFLYPMLTLRALDCIGREWDPVLLRPVVRYQARRAIDLSVGATFHFASIEDAIDEFGLLQRDIPVLGGPAESDTIAQLAHQLATTQPFSDHVRLIATALADGLSFEGAGEALSIAASRIFVSSTYGNPMDSHLHTGVNTRRYLLAVRGVSKRCKLLALLSGITGPECTCTESLMSWTPFVDPGELAALPERDESSLVEAIIECMENQPRVNWRASPALDQLTAPAVARDAMALAQQYVDCGYSAPRLFTRLSELVARDDFTELHAIKQHQAIIDEFETTRESLRSVHLIAAVKSLVIVRAGREQGVFETFQGLLH